MIGVQEKKKRLKEPKGITLIALIVTIILLIILGVISINIIFGEEGILERTKDAKFRTEIAALEEKAELYKANTYFNNSTIVEEIPNKGALSKEEKDEITNKIPTLAESVYRATGETLYERNLYWYDAKKAGNTTGDPYLIDMDTLQVYDYEGDYFYKKRWHTIKIGIEDSDEGKLEEIPEGYMRMHLYYPEDSIDRQWRIGRVGEIRENGELIWQDYIGEPILIKLSDIKNIWIRYNLKGIDVVEAPEGRLAVDIRISPTTQNVKEVTVSVYFDKDSTNQKIKVGSGGWRPYTGPFIVTENCTIEAMAEKTVNITDGEGTVIGTTKIKGKDSLKIKNIGEPEKDETLEAPIIEKIDTVGEEVARVKIEYPTDKGEIKKVYKINSGVEKEYTGEISVEEWGTEILAYYYKDEKQSKKARMMLKDPTKLDVEILVQPNPSVDSSIKETTVEIEYSEEAETKTYKIDEGTEQNYTGPIKITKNCKITAYARKTGIQDAVETETIKFKEEKLEEKEEITAPKIEQEVKEGSVKATIEIKYDEKATVKQYSINGEELQDYEGPFEAEDGDIIYAINSNDEGSSKDATHTVKVDKPEITAPKFSKEDNEDRTKAIITIEYDKNAETKQYNINGGELKDYTGPFEAENGDVIYAINIDKYGQEADNTYNVEIEPLEEEEIVAPEFSKEESEDKKYAMITITYADNAITKQYSINGGELKDYSEPIKAENGDVIYAINTNRSGKSADNTYTVEIEPLEEIVAPEFSKEESIDKKYATITITYADTAVTKQYSINGGELNDYSEPIRAENGDVIYAINTDKYGQEADNTYTVEIEPLEELKAPVINANYSADKQKATVSITYDSNAETNQYSINGGELKDYSSPFEVTENETVIYAISTDIAGNIKDATYTVNKIVKKLEVEITANPDTTEKVDSVMITINYDEKATEKTYKINGGTSNNYTGPFEITEKCTIEAEAKATDAYGKATKQIKNLKNGIVAPIIKSTKTKDTSGEIANITIEYDEESISNTYTINNGELKTYSSVFQITENDTIITAYSVDSKGNTATAQYIVKDLVRYILIDKNSYYWITLPYPKESINREYKYKENGIWKSYKEDGFILVKPEYEQELIQEGKPIKLEVEPGRYVDFDGHWYLLEGEISSLLEDIYMRWDDPENSSVPRVSVQIIAMPKAPTETDVVDVFIIYPPTATSKKYKINSGEWNDYESQLKITENNTTVTAKTQYSDGSWSEEVSYTITNIVPAKPEGAVDIIAEPMEEYCSTVKITIIYNPNSTTLLKKYKIGTEKWNYTQENEVSFDVTENVTIYAALENSQGESSEAIVYNVENIDKEPPVIKSLKPTDIGETYIDVSTVATDDCAIAKYEYKLNTGSYVEGSSTYQFTGLTKGTTYTLTVKVTDFAGNSVEESIELIAGSTIIRTVQDLENIANDVTAHYYIANDLDLAGKTWVPIADFAGTLDGGSHTINNFTFTNDSQYIGIFEDTLSGAKITNLNMTNVNINASSRYVSAVAAKSTGTTFDNINIQGNITTDTTTYAYTLYLGALTAYGSSDVINNVNVDMNITIPSPVNVVYVGGVVARHATTQTGVLMSNCHTSGKIEIIDTTKNSFVGGVICTADKSGTSGQYGVKDCSSTMDIDISGTYATATVGGFGSSLIRTALNNCYATGDIKVANTKASTSIVGGLVGKTEGYMYNQKVSGYWKLTKVSTTVSNCYATGNIEVKAAKVGGLIGDALGTIVSYSYATGNINGSGPTSSIVGGLIGSFGVILHEYASYSSAQMIVPSAGSCYSTGNITFTGNSATVGGLIGSGGGTIGSCFTTSDINVTGTSCVIGGIMGYQSAGKSANYGTTITAYIKKSYTRGTITGGTKVGGVLGNRSETDPPTISYAYYIKDVIGTTTNTMGTAIDTSALGKKQETYAGLDFEETWTIQEDITTPYLIKLPMPESVKEN